MKFMKFKDIKKGDQVLVRVRIQYGWNNSETFNLIRKVDRVTKTQFIIGDWRFSKSDGNGIGYSTKGKAFRLDEGFKDQSEEMAKFKQKLAMERRVRDVLGGITVKLNCHLTADELKTVYDELKLIKAKLTPNEEK